MMAGAGWFLPEVYEAHHSEQVPAHQTLSEPWSYGSDPVIGDRNGKGESY